MNRNKIIETIKEFPNEVELDALFEKLIFIEKVEKGIEQADKGETIDHDKVEAHFKKKWSK
jgi:predicted transcriptional regulator